jgi:hypothetical protein
LHDVALYNGRYYLYHGAGPAIMMFAPWRLITGYDLPENFAVFFLCFAGFLFSCGALLTLLQLAQVRLHPVLLAFLFLALGTCQSVPYLLNRIWVYEVAISGGYFFVSAATFFLARALNSTKTAYWLAASGLMFGMAIACRPHLGFAGAIALAGLIVYLAKSRREMPVLLQTALVAFVAPFVAVGLAVAAYNYARFGNPFEFGVRYLLAGEANQQQVRLALDNMFPGLYFMLLCPPHFSAIFPWVRLTMRLPFDSPSVPFPPGYFIEPTAGLLWLAPFILAVFLLPLLPRSARNGARIVLWVMLVASAAVLLFITATGFTTHRYQVDYAPWLCLTAIATIAILAARLSGPRRTVILTVMLGAVAYSVVANLALGISGPYDEVLTNRPASYLRIAGWFSPDERYRPVLSSYLDVDMNVRFHRQPYGFREPLVTTGYQATRHFLYLEHLEKKLRLVSLFEMSFLSHEFEWPEDRPVRVRLTYSASTGRLATSLEGVEVMSHQVKALVTAPAQVTIGENRIDVLACAGRFTGDIDVIENTMQPPTLLTSRE